MSDEKPKKEKKGKRMVDTNVRMEKTTHARLKYLAETLGVTMSEVIDGMIKEKYSDIDVRVSKREQEANELRKQLKKNDNQN
jgi:hypothetical protein